MKTLTCRDLGGVCDAPLTGETPDELMNNGTKHVIESTDEEHKKILAMMEETKNNPEMSKKWYEEFVAKFNAAPAM